MPEVLVVVVDAAVVALMRSTSEYAGGAERGGTEAALMTRPRATRREATDV